MNSPFRIEGPAVISFSGGRTSGYMLRRVLDEGLQPDVHILFENTGKEREETLSFIRECAQRWSAPVRWLERTAGGGVREVDFKSASRLGEPFDLLISERNAKRAAEGEPADLPGFRSRWCSVELKILTMRTWMLAAGYTSWTNVVGIRYDEPRRWPKYIGKTEKEWDYELPLFHSRATKRGTIRPFWAAQPFDLQLEDWEGNCDLCFLKGINSIRRVLHDRPDLGAWWIAHEDRLGVGFRRDRPRIEVLKRLEEAQARVFAEAEPAVADCICGVEAA